MSAKRILIVEDEKPLAQALQLKLEREGLEVEVVYSGQECFDILRKKKFDIILLDLMLPVIDGFKVLEELSKGFKTPVVYALTNLSQPEDRARAMSLGAKDFWVKSEMSLEEIVNKIKSNQG